MLHFEAGTRSALHCTNCFLLILFSGTKLLINWNKMSRSFLNIWCACKHACSSSYRQWYACLPALISFNWLPKQRPMSAAPLLNLGNMGKWSSEGSLLPVWKTPTHERLSVLGQTTISSGPGWTSTYTGTFSNEAFSRAAPPITRICASKGKSHMLDDRLTVSHASPINMELRTVKWWETTNSTLPRSINDMC